MAIALVEAGRGAFLLIACLAFAFLLCACASSQSSGAGGPSKSESGMSASDVPAAGDGSAGASSGGADSSSGNAAPVAYPTAWTIVDVNGIPAGTPVRVHSLPGFDIMPHRDGKAVSRADQEREQAAWPADYDGNGALVEFNGAMTAIDPGFLLVNLPDVLPDAVCDIVYSYSSTSNCAGIPIPGVTGQKLAGYVDGAQESPYWTDRRFVAPCAYGTALKAQQVAAALRTSGYRLLVYDAYRPMSAQYCLSDAFARAYWENPAIQEGVGWSLDWYVAPGPSGHNYGTDLDVGVCDLDGNPIAMPSSFDAFDENGHLTWDPTDSSSIGPEAYRAAVLENDACMALHASFTSAGFSELASEWWHFGDGETEAANRAIVGGGGLDFVAAL